MVRRYARRLAGGRHLPQRSHNVGRSANVSFLPCQTSQAGVLKWADCARRGSRTHNLLICYPVLYRLI